MTDFFSQSDSVEVPSVERLADIFLLESVSGFGPQKFLGLHRDGLTPGQILRNPKAWPAKGKRADDLRRMISELAESERQEAAARAERQLQRGADHSWKLRCRSRDLMQVRHPMHAPLGTVPLSPSDALTLLLTVEGLLFATLAVVAGLAAIRTQKRTGLLAPRVLGGLVTAVIALLALAAVIAWGQIYLNNFPSDFLSRTIAVILLVAIVVQPFLAILLTISASQ